MAWRESRASLRRMALLLASIAVGVAALVAISSFTHSLQEAVREQTLALGEARLVIRGVVPSMPGDVAVRSALGPRVFMSGRDLDATALLGFGARARYEAYLKLPAAADPQRLALRHRPALAAERVNL